MLTRRLVETLAALAVMGIPIAAAAVPAQRLDSNGVMRYYCCGAPPVLRCDPGNECDLELAPDESLDINPVADQTNWSIVATHGRNAHVFFQPLAAVGKETLLTIVTTRRTYHVELKAVRDGAHRVYGFLYPAEPPPPPLPPLPAPAPTPTPPPLGGRYRIVGAAPFRPTVVGNDGTRTYLVLPHLAEYPTLAALDNRGTAEAIDYAIRQNDAGGRTYIAPGLYPSLVLTIGSGKGTQEVRVDRE